MYENCDNNEPSNRTKYLYDGDGRICAVANYTVPYVTIMAGYLYDVDGVRIAKGTLTTFSCNTAVNNFAMTTSYILGPGNEQLTELNWSGGAATPAHTNVFAAGQLVATYLFNNNVNASSPATVYFHITDWLGTRRALTDYTGEIQQTCDSLPFGSGEDCPTLPTEHLFTGKERDAESGNDYFGARYYASTLGRFLSPDPSQLYYANPAYPQSLNLYTYGRNNPLVNIDPTGMDCVYDDGGGNFHTTTGDCDNSTEALANAGHYINCDGCTTNSTGGTLDPTTGTMYLTDANGNGIAGTNISDWAAPQGTPATNVDVGGRSNDVWMSGYGLGGQLAYFPMAAMPQLPNGSVRDPIAPRHGANLRQWWTAVWGCLSSTDTAPRGVQAPPSSTETDSNPAADVRTYSDSREQGHQVSEPFGNARASGAAENYGNAAALFQDFNNCVSRNLAGFVH